MSRTYRKSGITDCYPNLEAWEAKEVGYAIQSISNCEAKKRKYPDRDMSWLNRNIEHYQNELGDGVNRAKKWFSHFRDGRYSWFNTSPRKRFRNHCNELIRTKTRHLEQKIIKDPEAYDNLSFPDKHDTKYLYWVYD